MSNSDDTLNKMTNEFHQMYLDMQDELFSKKPAIVDEELLIQLEQCIQCFDERTINAYKKFLEKYTDDYEVLTNNELLVLNVSSLESSFTYRIETIETDNFTFTVLSEIERITSLMLNDVYDYSRAYQTTLTVLKNIIRHKPFELSQAIGTIRIIELLYAYGHYSDEIETNSILTTSKFQKPLDHLLNRINKMTLRSI